MAGKATKEKLFVLLLMTILPQAFFALMRSNFMTLSFFTTRHTVSIFLNKLLLSI
jgi:hypothetical protein